jgi:signal peptidase II
MNRITVRLGLIIAVLIIIADQISKYLILDRLFVAGEICKGYTRNPPIVLTDFLNFILVCNKGISFGVLNRDSAFLPWIFSALSIVIVIVLLIWLWRSRLRFPAIAIGLVIGGALGNVIDRVRFGGVVDFVNFHIGSWNFAIFNVADAAISIGVVLLLADSLFTRRESPK